MTPLAIKLDPLTVATAYSRKAAVASRRARRRDATIDEALDHAVGIMCEQGVGGLTISEMARRMGIRGPSLYKYFPSLHAVYDALFARGQEANSAAVRAAIDPLPPGVARIRAAAQAIVRWCVANPALAQLLHWRPVPRFEPSPSTFAASVAEMQEARAEFAEAVRLGQLSRAAASAEALRLFTVVISGIVTQQLANQPGAGYDDGLFSRLTDDALDMFFAHYGATPQTPTRRS